MVASSAPVIGSRATTKMVSSPAIVPTTYGRAARSIALARYWAAPGGVRSTARLPLASVDVSRSPSSRDIRSVPPETPRTGLPSSGTT